MGENNQSPVKRPPVKWLAPVSVDKKGTTFGRPDLCTVCRGNDDIAIVLNYFLYEASLEAERKKIDTSELQSIQLERTLDTILEGIGNSCSKKTLIKYINQLKTWELVYPHGYKKTYDVCFKKIAEDIKSPPEPEQKKPRGRHVKVKSTILTIPTIHDEKEIVQIEFLQSQIVELQSNVVTLQSQIVTLQSFVVTLQSLQRPEAAPQQALTRAFDPSRLLDCNKTLKTNRDVYMSVASANGRAHTSSMQSLLTEGDMKTIDDLIATLPMKIDYVSANAERTPAFEFDQEQAETLKALQAGLMQSGVIDESPIATTDTPTTLLQAEQERETHNANPHPMDTRPTVHAPLQTGTAQATRQNELGDSHNGHGSTNHHGTGDTSGGGTLLPLVPADGSGSTTGTQATQEVIPVDVDKSLTNGDKSSKGKKSVVPTGPLVMPPDDAKWCAETAVQMIEARKGRRYGETTRKQELAKATEALRYEIDGKPITRAQFTRAWEQMESWPLWVEKHITPMIKHLVKDDRIVTLLQQKRKATSAAVRHGPGAEMIEYEGEMMTRDEANKRGYSDFDRYIGNGKAEREAMIEEAMKDPLFYEIINDGRKVG